jgi:signal transduction histidine kinase
VDPFRLDQVFRNILENALAACKDPVRITVACSDGPRLVGERHLPVGNGDGPAKVAHP